MAEDHVSHVPAPTGVGKPLSLIPVSLKEAALDSPTFRATVQHFGEQIDLVEKWLDNYVKSASRLSNEVSGIENIINTYLSWTIPPAQVSEAVLDHDYTGLALKRYNEGAKEFWSSTIKWMKKVESSVVDPIRAYLQTDLASLKNYRRILEQCQRNFDSQVARYAAQSKTKEPSALREDAFQLHEARKAYLKASMDFCVAAPQARSALDKLLVKIFADRWRDMKNTRDTLAGNLSKWSFDIDRIRGWSKEMENTERVFKKELQEARKTIEEAAANAIKPSRDLDDYAKSTVAYLGQAPDTRCQPRDGVEEKTEKQGWLFQRTMQGKPARTLWIRRWYYVRHGIFGSLSNNPRTGAVEESEKIGVLLCGVRPAFQDERRFCFEVKTKDATMELQAETQSELMEWIATFEVAKRKALENPASTEAIAAGSKSVDAAFAVTPPIAPEFAAKNPELRSEDDALVERSNTMTLEPPSNIVSRASTDLGARRSLAEGGESTRERMLQKLDLHRSKGSISPAPGTPSPMSGIASLISASHTVLPLGAAGHNLAPSLNISTDFKSILGNQIPPSSLAPSTLANPPTPTNLSRTAVAVSGEKNLSLGSAAIDGGMPGGIMANVWGSNNWGYLNRLERGEVKPSVERRRSMSQPPSPNMPQDSTGTLTSGVASARSPSPVSGSSTPLVHRKTVSMTPDITRSGQIGLLSSGMEYPNYYPLSLKVQDAQFRTLFPEVKREDKLIMVFRATWNPTDQSEFPGRVFVTMNHIYFYSHHLGLVLISGVSFDAISEVTAAPGKDSDFIFLHLRPDISVDGATRITLRTYLEPLKLLQKRLTYLIRNADSAEPESLQEVIKNLIKMEAASNDDSPSLDDWEDVSPFTPTDGATRSSDGRTGFRIDGTLFPDPSKPVSKNATKFKLPAQPVNYVPQGMVATLVEKDFNITAKALFHVLAGDKSTVFQMLNRENGAENLLQGPWVQTEQQTHFRREFKYTVQLGGKPREIVDMQIIDVFNDHLCYVITERRTPWFLPSARNFSIIFKMVLTHVAKSKCKFAIYAKIEWRKRPLLTRRLLEEQALADAGLLAKSLVEILTDQIAALGSSAQNNSRKAVQIYGNVGQSKEILRPAPSDLPTSSRDHISPHSIGALVMRSSKTYAINALLAVIGAVIYLAQALAKVSSAHSILVTSLICSSMMNFYFANKDMWGWYRDRQARHFMKGIGVHPSTGFGHSIWLRDLDTLATPQLSISTSKMNGSSAKWEELSLCRENFNFLLAQTDPSSPPLTSKSQKQDVDAMTISRLQKTRDNFGTYRHNLLVALKVIERVEKETISAEWESWIRKEVGRCRASKKIVQESGGDDSLSNWWKEYCGSCEAEIASDK
ncbi:uncharacterized protein PV09_02740 [Verruconis gallopava]|uniref:Transcription factor SipA3 n=1 Tax=Verruconis gallopava TaxID=253628 RepID=A0A0D2AH69_9PEZI|nr:uncharacterized protein PV09_02740 [Verruconis gallopava]KIW06268.1 hypothetical protein PV09_02740 [Verruconis gallopava]